MRKKSHLIFATIGLALICVGYAFYYFSASSRLDGDALLTRVMADLQEHCIVDGKYDEDRLKNYFLSRRMRENKVKTVRGEGPLLIHVIDEMNWDPRFELVTRENIYKWLKDKKEVIGIDVTEYYPPQIQN